MAPALSVNLQAYDLDSLMTVVEAKYAQVRDYTCTMAKKELVDGDYVSWKNVTYKHRKSNNYYMKWTEGSMAGMEVIYAGKKYNNKIKSHLGGLLNVKNFDLDPKGTLAMKDNRHSILESDLGFTIQLMKKNLQNAKKLKVGKIEYLKDATVSGRNTMLFKAVFPSGMGFFAATIFIYIDKSLVLPVKFDIYDWDKKLLESYTFSNMKVNTGLKDIDFDINNEEYSF